MADIQVKYTSDMQKLLRDQDKTIQKQDQQIAKLNATVAASKKAGNEASSSSSKAAKGADLHSAAISKVASSVRNTIGQYVAFNAVLSGVNATIRDNIALSKESAELQKSLGAAQQEAAKNLTGLTTAEKKEILEVTAPGIQRETLFPKQAEITKAIGAGFSASGNRDATVSAVTESAKLTRLTPESLSAVSAGALDLAQATGIQDAKKNLGFLLTAGAINRIEDPTALSRNVAPIVTSAVASAPKQDPEEAAREAGALFGTLAKLAADPKGESSGTAAITLIGKLDTFFKERGDDPGTLFGRMEALQKDDSLRKEVLGDEGFGEQKFKKGIELLLTGGTRQVDMLRDAKEQVKFDSSVFDTQVKELNTLTPAIRGAMIQAASEAQLELAKSQPEEARAATRRDIMMDTLRQTRRPSDFLAVPMEQLQGIMADVGIGSAEGNLAMRRDALLGRSLPGGGEPTKKEMESLSPERRSDVELIGQQLDLLLEHRQGFSTKTTRDLREDSTLKESSMTLRDAAKALQQAADRMNRPQSEFDFSQTPKPHRPNNAPAARQATSAATE